MVRDRVLREAVLRRSAHFVFLVMLSWGVLAGGVSSDPFGVSGPLEQVVDWFTGIFARSVVVLGTLGVGALFLKQQQAGGEGVKGLLFWLVAGGLMMGAQAIVDGWFGACLV